MDGLNEKDIEYRVNNHLVNNEDIKNSRSLKEIVLSNTITLFNVIHLVLFVLVLTTGSINNATFIFSILINTFISIYQEIKAKIIVDKLKIATVSKINVIRNGKKTSILPEEILDASTKSSVNCFSRCALLSRISIYPLAGSSVIFNRFNKST